MANSEDRKNLENAESAERAGKFSDRDYRVRVTKMLIRKQFTELLAAKPIQSITVRELCERTGINRSTFYNHYRDVYDLLEKIEEEMLAELAEQLKKIAGESGLMSVGFFEGIFRFLGQNMDVCAVVLGDNGDKRFLYRMLEMGRKSCVDAYSRAFPNAAEEQIEDFYVFVSNGCIGLIIRWLKQGMKRPPEELARTAMGIMTQALGFFQKR